MPKIGRDVLKQFLPNHETIVAFEKLLNFMDESPSDIEEILSLVSSIKRVNIAGISARIASLEVPQTRGYNDTRATARVDDMESLQAQRVNLSSIMKRLDALELAQQRRENNTALMQRIQNIENFLGI